MSSLHQETTSRQAPRGRRIYRSTARRAIREGIAECGTFNVETALAADFPYVRWPLDLPILIERERLYHRLNEIGW
jgi:hypothetical protein